MSPRTVNILHGLVPVLAAVAWFLALDDVDPRVVGDLGLVAALPWGAFAALAFALISFAHVIGARSPNEGLALVHVVALIVMLFGATGAVAEVPSFSVSWRHAGVAQHIVEHGSIDRSIDAYFNWPGFFALAASASELAGLDNPIGLARHAPVVLNLLYLPPLVLIARSVTADPRAVWGGVWIFFAANWVGQDYFSPQGLTFVLFLVLLAAVLTWFPAAPRELGRAARSVTRRLLRLQALRFGIGPLEDPPLRPSQRAALVLVGALLVVATVPTHQLTPFAMIVMILPLALLGRCSYAGLPLLLIVATAGWLAFAAAPYLEGHIDALKGEIGQVGGTLSASVADRVAGSDEHRTVVYIRIALTVLVWGLGLAGAVSLMLRRTRWPTAALVVLAPLTLVLLQGYGGEILLRVYMFGLPFVAVFAGVHLANDRFASQPWTAGVATAAAGALVLGGFLFARYGNERVNLFTPDEVAALDRAYSLAPPGAVLVSPNPNLPWQGQEYADHAHVALSRELPDLMAERGPLDLAAETERLIHDRGEAGGFVVVTRSARAYDELLGAQEWGSTSDLEAALARSPAFERIYATPDATIFELGGGT